MTDFITPEFIPGIRETQKSGSAIGTADFIGGKFPAPEMDRASGTRCISIRLLPCDESQGYNIGRAYRHLSVARGYRHIKTI